MDKQTLIKVGNNINWYRRERKLSVRDLANKVESRITPEELTLIEKGRKDITFVVMNDIARALKITTKLLYPEQLFMDIRIYGSPASQPKMRKSSTGGYVPVAGDKRKMSNDMIIITDDIARTLLDARLKLLEYRNQISKRIGVSNETISRTEQAGLRVKKRTLKKLSDCYGIEGDIVKLWS